MASSANEWPLQLLTSTKAKPNSEQAGRVSITSVHCPTIGLFENSHKNRLSPLSRSAGYAEPCGQKGDPMTKSGLPSAGSPSPRIGGGEGVGAGGNRSTWGRSLEPDTSSKYRHHLTCVFAPWLWHQFLPFLFVGLLCLSFL